MPEDEFSSNIKSIAEKWMKQLEYRSENPLCRIVDGKVILSCKPDFDQEYEIQLSQISTQISLLRWVCHLSDKTWVSKDHLEALIYDVCKHYGWELYPEK